MNANGQSSLSTYDNDVTVGNFDRDFNYHQNSGLPIFLFSLPRQKSILITFLHIPSTMSIALRSLRAPLARAMRPAPTQVARFSACAARFGA